MYNDFNYERFVNSDELRQTTQYVVKQGDSVYGIATKFDVNVNDLIRLNKLSSTMIYPNQVLFIPTRKNNIPNNNAMPNVSNMPNAGHNNSIKYVTTQGDTVMSLKHKYGDKFDYYVLRVEPNQTLKLKNAREIIVDDNMNMDTVLTDNNLTAEEFLRLNENDIFKPGKKIIT